MLPFLLPHRVKSPYSVGTLVAFSGAGHKCGGRASDDGDLSKQQQLNMY